MAPKNNTLLPWWALLLITLVLTAGGWLMASFPWMILLAYAPLFALTNRAQNTDSVWEKLEWIWLGLTGAFLAARHFQTEFIVGAMLQAAVFTLPFVTFVWVRATLGPRVGKFLIILFWLAGEYLLLKLIPQRVVFLADSLSIQTAAVQWTIHTGYLGLSAWILISALIADQALLSLAPQRAIWIAAWVIVVAGPIIYGLALSEPGIARNTMIDWYANGPQPTNSVYLARGEWVARTAAWLTALILLFTFVRSKTGKR